IHLLINNYKSTGWYLLNNVFFSQVGAALPVDVLTYEEKTLSAILRVVSSGLVKLWSALTLLGFYQNRRCAFRVLQASPFLLALSGNSRELVLD
uniref:Ribonuclease P/MRP subunit p14 n=1 Tax=Buteo japonicus TaxID=224669 RepID=A0A8C0BMQ4_9AVES